MKHKGLKLLLCSLALVTIVTGCNLDSSEKNNKPTKEQKKETTVIEDVKVNDLKISGLNISFKDGLSTVVASVTNDTENTISLSSITVYLKNDKDKLIVETLGNIGDFINPGETKSFTSFITMDVRNAVKADYKINK